MKTNSEKYKDAFRVLHTSGDFQMEVSYMKKSKWLSANRIAAKAAIIACVFMLSAGTVFAARYFLSPAEVANEVGNAKLEAAFQSDQAVLCDETQSIDNYDIRLLGMVSGEDLSDAISEEREGEFSKDRTYVAVAIERKDGKGVGDGDSFFVMPLIDGVSPEEFDSAKLIGRSWTLYSDENKMAYCIVDMENIEPFADRKIYIGVQDGGGLSDEGTTGEMPYQYDEKAGTFRRNEDYDGLNALFELPVSSGKADHGKAGELLESIRR